MENNISNNCYKASEGKLYQRIVDGFRMGDTLYLGKFIDGTVDVIENYVEVDKTEEELAEEKAHEERHNKPERSKTDNVKAE